MIKIKQSVNSKLGSSFTGVFLLILSILGFIYTNTVFLYFINILLFIGGLFVFISIFQCVKINKGFLYLPIGFINYRINLSAIKSIGHSLYPSTLRIYFENKKGKLIYLDIGEPENTYKFTHDLVELNSEIYIDL